MDSLSLNGNVQASPACKQGMRLPTVSLVRGVGVAVTLGALITVMLVSLDLPLLGDEQHHVGQVRLFLRGEWRLLPTLTTIPGYHLILSLCAGLAGHANLPSLRLYSDLFSIAGLSALYTLARQRSEHRPTERLLQIVFLPVLFPLLFFVYTDVAALSLFALALLLESRGRTGLSALAGFTTLLVRQNYIIWVLFIAVHHVLRRTTRAAPSDLAGYGICAAAFGAFVVGNHGVALGDRGMHPFPGLYPGNVYFALAVAFFVLFPLHVANARAIAGCMRRPGTVLCLLTGLAFFLMTFRVDHPYNQPALDWWLHNRLLNAFDSSLPARLGMFAAGAIAALSLCVTPLHARSQYLIYPFAVVSMLPSWQIEPRYCVPALVLFILFRVQRSVAFEWSLIGYLMVLSTMMISGIVMGSYFI